VRRTRVILSLLLALVLLCPSAPALAASDFNPADALSGKTQALQLLSTCAFRSEYGNASEGQTLTRWEDEITIWVGGSATKDDLATLDQFIMDLSFRVPSLPVIRRVKRDTDAAIRIWYVPFAQMQYYVEGYIDDNWGFFHYEANHGSITSARIAIASDITDQQERNHLLLEEIVGSLGLPNDHNVFSDSIIYQQWTTVQSLSEVDWLMLNMLYSPVTSPGMTWAQTGAALRQWMGLQ